MISYAPVAGTGDIQADEKFANFNLHRGQFNLTAPMDACASFATGDWISIAPVLAGEFNASNSDGNFYVAIPLTIITAPSSAFTGD